MCSLLRRQFLAKEVLGLVAPLAGSSPSSSAPAGSKGKGGGQQQGQGQEQQQQEQQHSLLWVTDFPMFEYDEEQKRWGRRHGVGGGGSKGEGEGVGEGERKGMDKSASTSRAHSTQQCEAIR